MADGGRRRPGGDLPGISGLKKSGDKWEDGKIYNPKNGKTYRCSMWLEGKELKVRGHLGIFHETQTWKRK